MENCMDTGGSQGCVGLRLCFIGKEGIENGNCWVLSLGLFVLYGSAFFA